MQRVPSIAETRAALAAHRAAGRSVGFVPTMGYLHEGHLALVRRSIEENDVTAVSVFVNPAQFGPEMDLDRYPRDIKGDEAKLAELGVDVLFYPSEEAMYPAGYSTWVEVEGLTERLDGGSRPGYFRGICTVVLKLFHIAQPSAAYFGQKDIQQAMVIRRMVADLDLDLAVRVMPTVRADDGLALSSRNAYLSPADRALAPQLAAALGGARERFRGGELRASELIEGVRADLAAEPRFGLDYVDLVALATMQRIDEVREDACLALAVDLAGTRLIDNVLLLPDGRPDDAL
ncbi:MAG: pantoate--beta-alanine ligase [Planctomycetota bacterium]